MGPEPEPEPEEGGTAELRLREIYAQHARHKLADVPALLVQFAGRESELVEKVERKYILVRGQPPASCWLGCQSRASHSLTVHVGPLKGPC
eukprot:COSAG01_NODE_2176_length_8220_cov_15.093215_1_plen_91_part_00